MKKLETPVIPLALTPARAAASVDCGVDYFAEHIQPELRVVRRGKKTLIPVAEIAQWLDDHAEDPITDRLERAS